ncbi:hypothetical protein L228DRAFT_51955 [Xylona heveae TC161]|uniref:Uncharacterized protein n=1 Tax=Xylona heveae (strain CBS 132557 / TC161) TaxID=1328760 RepID=A0A164ZEC8_XYLHT|nr:hypothetical protein L228DRAFT_51955 [Xylona heveae TC161]KZF18994.1 hypothetical protein L228DRAFT_51955 [Xylona heveae TC161]
MRTNFTDCKIGFLSTPEKNIPWRYEGPIHGLSHNVNRSEIISLEGCLQLCGHGTALYSWSDASQTISTWVLPIIGMILQAPFESNDFWGTVWTLCRWVGSPIASLSYVLWNIRVTGKCALMIDMAVPYRKLPDEDSEFAKVRDSLYILSVMNQFKMHPNMPSGVAEKLLRIALFSDQLKLSHKENAKTLEKMRQKLAKDLRETRRRGIVPVFISLGWFFFSLAISIQAAFGQIGENATAHNLALGLLYGWMPVLILCGIVDRNPVATDQVRQKFNRLIDSTRLALLDDELREQYLRDIPETDEDFRWIPKLSDSKKFSEEFFVSFAGQGRVRCHYGVAHPILSGIEASFVAEYGRNWLRYEDARQDLVRGREHPQGLHSFDLREIWQILSALFIVGGTCASAFAISFHTPTWGLGCRSGGYMIFFMLSFLSFVLEMLTWSLFYPSGHPKSLTKRRGTDYSPSMTRTDRARGGLRRWWTDMSPRDRLQFILLTPFEFGSLIWLLYITIAQTFGMYQTCRCMSSSWTPMGGYIDFAYSNFYWSKGVLEVWANATAVSCAIMAVGIAFIVNEWCTQSHMSSENYQKAMNGLRRTRAWKRRTLWLSHFPNMVIGWVKRLFVKPSGENQEGSRRSLVWSVEEPKIEQVSRSGSEGENDMLEMPLRALTRSYTSSFEGPRRSNSVLV